MQRRQPAGDVHARTPCHSRTCRRSWSSRRDGRRVPEAHRRSGSRRRNRRSGARLVRVPAEVEREDGAEAVERHPLSCGSVDETDRCLESAGRLPEAIRVAVKCPVESSRTSSGSRWTRYSRSHTRFPPHPLRWHRPVHHNHIHTRPSRPGAFPYSRSVPVAFEFGDEHIAAAGERRIKGSRRRRKVRRQRQTRHVRAPRGIYNKAGHVFITSPPRYVAYTRSRPSRRPS